jgi:23S rRNA pseudouridine1911/1915/1917 synthase
VKKTHSRNNRSLSILFEDDDFIVIDKPSGLLTIATESQREKTAYWQLSELLRRRGSRQKIAVVHRLDRDTSGVLLFVKNQRLKQELMARWNELVERRTYIALVEGVVRENEGVINQPLGETKTGLVIVSTNGKPAITHWKVLERGAQLSLLELELETGRRNQIRAHMDWMRYPVAGDPKYHSKLDPIGRLALHASCIRFRHPFSGEVFEFSCPPGVNFKTATKIREK